MTTEIRVPVLGESITEATIGKWFKQTGEAVAIDEPLVELETDKVTVEVPSPINGTIAEIVAKDGETVEVGALLGAISAGSAPAAASSAPAAKPKPTPEPKPAAAANAQASAMSPAPSARKIIAETGVDEAAITGTGKRGQVLKGDVLAALTNGGAPATATPVARAPGAASDTEREERVRMSRLRQTIARRLKLAQETAAMLTTFNEVDMTAIIALRTQYKELFEKKHGQKLGFMGFFVAACVAALKDIPAVNAEIDGDEMVYKNYYHMGIAVGTPRGLVVPVVRDADRLSLAGIEKTIGDLGRRARDGKISIEEMQGGTFTITNGGVYGSLMSTPILNPPQSGVLGMHKIQQRPMVVDGEVKVRPMMYLALSYDHRIVDGKEAVTFLVRVKENIEDPQRLVLDL